MNYETVPRDLEKKLANRLRHDDIIPCKLKTD